MKTLDEVIKALELCTGDYDCVGYECPYRQEGNNCDLVAVPKMQADALHYLKEYRKDKQIYAYDIARRHFELAERNDPLTWDELKQMEGKPVYLEQYWYPMEDETGVTEEETETDKYWAVIDNVQAKRIHFVGKNLNMGLAKSGLDPNKHGGWQAYRKEK